MLRLKDTNGKLSKCLTKRKRKSLESKIGEKKIGTEENQKGGDNKETPPKEKKKMSDVEKGKEDDGKNKLKKTVEAETGKGNEEIDKLKNPAEAEKEKKNDVDGIGSTQEKKPKKRRKRKKKKRKKKVKVTEDNGDVPTKPKRHRRTMKETWSHINPYDGMVTRSSVEPSITETDDDDDGGLNVVINYNDFVSMAKGSFVCRYCKSAITDLCINRKTIGIATEISYKCCNPNCKHEHTIEPEIVERMSENKEQSFLGKKFRPNKNRLRRYIGSYAINLKLVLLCQQFGLSEAGTQQIISSLGLSSFKNSFS